MSNWHLDQNGKRIGPITQDVLLQMVTAGHINPGDLVWTDGMQAWQRADTQSWFPGAQQGTVLPPISLVNNQATTQGDASAPGSFNTIPPAPPNLLVFSIVEIFCCCVITGVIGIVYDSKAKTEYLKGNYAAAQSAYDTGKLWLIIGAILGAVGSVLYIILMVVGALNSNH